jgi:tetratricopeptide (TPR) repeat protein
MTSRRRQPPTAPPDLWTRPEMSRALTDRDMGAVVRIFRRWTGASQTHISELVGMPQPHVSELERGLRHVIALDLFERFAAGLGIPRYRLGLAEVAEDGELSPAAQLLEQPPGDDLEPVKIESLVRASEHDSLAFMCQIGQDSLDPVVLEQFQADTSRLALKYSTAAPADVLREVRDLRTRVFHALTERRQAKEKDLYLVGGYLSGILAYAVLDLGYPDAAMTNTRLAWMCGERAGHNGLRAWVRGTQSLIARFQSRYEVAYESLQAGLQYATEGTALARLRCGEAQCLAHFGDSKGAHAALNSADDALDAATTADELGGLFTFPRAKRYYYAGSSLIWLPGRENAEAAEAASEKAIDLWQKAPLAERSLADELLVRIYLATARLNQGEVEGVLPALQPVLEAPPEVRSSWQGKRLTRIGEILAGPEYRHSTAARDVKDRIDEFEASPSIVSRGLGSDQAGKGQH